MNLELVREMIDAGATQAQIAARVGRCSEFVRRFLKEHGLRTAYAVKHETLIAAQTMSRNGKSSWNDRDVKPEARVPDWPHGFEDVARALLDQERTLEGWRLMPARPCFALGASALVVR